MKQLMKHTNLNYFIGFYYLLYIFRFKFGTLVQFVYFQLHDSCQYFKYDNSKPNTRGLH